MKAGWHSSTIFSTKYGNLAMVKPRPRSELSTKVVAALLIVVGMTIFTRSHEEAGAKIIQDSPVESADEVKSVRDETNRLTNEIKRVIYKVNRAIDEGSIDGLPQSIEELERLQELVPIDPPRWGRDTGWPLEEKARALTTIGRYTAASGRREEGEKYHLKALAVTRIILSKKWFFNSGTSFVKAFEAYVDYLLQAPDSLSPVQLFDKVHAQIGDGDVPDEAKNVLVERADAIYALLPRYDTSASGEWRCKQSAGVARALLIGNNGYRGELNQLKGSINDVQILKKSLEVRGVTGITVLQDANRDRMVSEMQRLVHETRCGDFVLFHFSGKQGFRKIGSLTPLTGFETGLLPVDDGHSDIFSPTTIFNAELSQFLTALRNRGASVVFALDAGAHVAAIETLQKRAATPNQWSAQLDRVKLLEKQLDRGLMRVGDHAADYAVFAPRVMGLEKEFHDSRGQSLTYGVLSYSLARVLQTQAEPTVKDVARGLAKEMANIDVLMDDRTGFGSFAATASKPDLVFLKPIKPINSDTLRIEVLSPKLQEVRGAIPLQEPTFELIGRVDDHASIARLMLDYKPIKVDQNGQFREQIELSPGQNRVTFAAFRNDMSFQTKTLEFTYEGDLARFAAVGEKYALIIGIENYDSRTVWTPLTTPRNDALAVADQLRNAYGFKTDLVLPSGQKHSLVLLDAGLRDLTSALTLLRQRLTENDSLLIYYAGHGKRLEDNKVAYWIPKDGKPDDQFTWLSAGQLISELKRMNVRSVLVVSDSCFSGAMTREPADLSAFSEERRRALLKAGTKKSRILISSGGTEPVLDTGCREDATHSVFACAFLAALAKTEHPIFSSGDLHHTYLLPLVSGRVQQQPERKELADSGHEGGDFVFSKTEALEAGRRIENAITRTK